MEQWTVERVVAELPSVKAKIGNQVVTGDIVGRHARFPRIMVNWHGVRIGYEVAWTTLVHCLNNDRPVILD